MISGATHCYFCRTKFGFFKKQYECSLCSYAACVQCVPHKIDNKLVCRNCYKLKMKGGSSYRDAPPANFTREIQKRKKESIEKKESDDSLKELTMRLNKIKEPIKNRPPVSKESSVKELEERLEKLKMRKDGVDGGGDSVEELQRRLDNLKEKKPPAIRVMSYVRLNYLKILY